MKTVKDLVDAGGCSVPWLHTEISLQHNSVYPCCKYKGIVGKAEDFKTAWFSQQYQQLRKDQTDAQTHPACSACAVSESAFSYQKFKNRAYQHLLSNTKLEPVILPQIFHFTLQNTCNLACRMCHPISSSKLGEMSRSSKFFKEYWGDININNQFDISQLAGSFANLRQLTITGGEPLIQRSCIKLIEMVKKEAVGLKRIVFSTNMTMFQQNIIDMLDDLKIPVAFNISIDGPRAIHEYIRHGCQWTDIVTNLTYLNKNYNFEFGINSTISALNVGYLPELINEVDKLGKQADIKFTHLMATPVLEKHLHAGSLPENIKKAYLHKLNLYTPDSPMDGVQEFINAGKELLQASIDSALFKRYIKEFDLAANTSIDQVYPELAD